MKQKQQQQHDKHDSIDNPYYLHRTCIGKIKRNYPVTREVTDQGRKTVHLLGRPCFRDKWFVLEFAMGKRKEAHSEMIDVEGTKKGRKEMFNLVDT